MIYFFIRRIKHTFTSYYWFIKKNTFIIRTKNSQYVYNFGWNVHPLKIQYYYIYQNFLRPIYFAWKNTKPCLL